MPVQRQQRRRHYSHAAEPLLTTALRRTEQSVNDKSLLKGWANCSDVQNVRVYCKTTWPQSSS